MNQLSRSKLINFIYLIPDYLLFSTLPPSHQRHRQEIIILHHRVMSTQLEGQSLVIVTNRTALRSQHVYHMLVLQWVLMGYYVYLFGSIVHSGMQYQLRVLLYCIVFLLFEKLELTHKYLEFEDPLQLLPGTRCVRAANYLCVGNITALLVRIFLQNHNMHAFIMFMHYLLTFVFFLNDLSKRNTKLDMNIDHSSLFSKMVTPLLLFIFNKTSETALTEFWFIQFLVFATNLFLTIQLERVLLLRECQYFGWMSFEESGKAKSNWSRKRALRTIIVICCILIVTQNLLLIFDKIKYEISVTIWHTFTVAVLAYLLYAGHFPFQK